MFLFRKRSSEKLDLGWLHADMHSHLIPGIDDGAPDMKTSMELIKGLGEIGYGKLITTPHILWEIYPNTIEVISEGLGELKRNAAAEGINIELNAAAEYFIDDYFDTQLATKAPLLKISENMVLVEFSMVTAPMDLQTTLFEAQLQNYQPVIAHPERYTYLTRRKEVFDDLKNAGCMFQMNLLSLTGYYGEPVQELAEYLIKKEYYDLAGTDLHGQKHLSALQKLAGSQQLKRLKDSGMLKNAHL